jgi:hypothetical protein
MEGTKELLVVLNSLLHYDLTDKDQDITLGG